MNILNILQLGHLHGSLNHLPVTKVYLYSQGLNTDKPAVSSPFPPSELVTGAGERQVSHCSVPSCLQNWWLESRRPYRWAATCTCGVVVTAATTQATAVALGGIAAALGSAAAMPTRAVGMAVAVAMGTKEAATEDLWVESLIWTCLINILFCKEH